MIRHYKSDSPNATAGADAWESPTTGCRSTRASRRIPRSRPAGFAHLLCRGEQVQLGGACGVVDPGRQRPGREPAHVRAGTVHTGEPDRAQPGGAGCCRRPRARADRGRPPRARDPQRISIAWLAAQIRSRLRWRRPHGFHGDRQLGLIRKALADVINGFWAGRTPSPYSEVFSPGFAVRGRLGEASLQVKPLCRRSVEGHPPGACVEGPRPKSLTTR